jgi:hypothetical protein
VDPGIPLGVVVLRSPAEQVIGLTNEDYLRLQSKAAASPALAENCRSILESAPYLIRHQEGTSPITCECCGTEVSAMPEADHRAGRPYTWRQAIWEPETGRKHTLRRCNWIREQRLATM